MTLEELKTRSRRMATSQFTGMTYALRSLSQIEFSRAQLNAILPAARPTEKEIDAALLQVGHRTLNTMQWVLEHGVQEPRIVFGDREPGEGEAHASWLGQDEAFLYEQILKLSGLDDESQKALESFLKNRNGSEPTPPLGESTEYFQAHSSSSGPSN